MSFLFAALLLLVSLPILLLLGYVAMTVPWCGSGFSIAATLGVWRLSPAMTGQQLRIDAVLLGLMIALACGLVTCTVIGFIRGARRAPAATALPTAIVRRG